MNTLEDKLNYHIDFLKYVTILHIHSISNARTIQHF